MSQNNTPRRPPSDTPWFMRSRELLLLVAFLILVAGAFIIGRRANATQLPNTTPTTADSLAGATIPPPITRVPTSTPHPPVPTLAPPTPQPSPTPIIVTSATVLRRIENTSLLQTTVFHIDTLVRAQKQGSWLFDWGGQRLLLFVKGSVAAGVDLKELKNVVISDDEHQIIMTLPKAKILSATLDSYEIQTYDGQPAGQVAADLLKSGLDAGRQEIAANACESGIIDQATSGAQAALEQLMQLDQFPGYKVIVLPSQEKGCSIEVALPAHS